MYGVQLLSIVAAMALPCAAVAQNEKDAEIDSLRGEVAELRAEVHQLRASTGAAWLTEQRADEIRGLVQDVLADADTRASLLQDGMTAGWDKNFYLASADGNWKLRFKGQIQVRWALNNANGQSPSAPNTLYGFEIRRAKIKFDGHVVDPTWKYVLNLAADHDDKKFDSGVGGALFSAQGDVFLEDAIIKKNFENGLELWFGQFKMPFLQEELVSSTKQQAVERSLVNEEFNQDRAKGIMAVYTTDQLKIQGAFHDGFKSLNTPFSFVPVTTGSLVTGLSSSIGLTGRVDWLAKGNWKQFGDMTSPRGSENGLKVGGAVHWEQDKYTEFVAGVGTRTSFFGWTIDGMWESDGWNVLAYIVGRHVRPDAGTNLDQYGIVVQGGYYLTDEWEGFARYEWGDNDVGGAPDLSVLTVGANYYINKHNLKWTTDIGFGLNEVVSTWSAGGADWRSDAAGETGQVVFRSQFQLLF
jgi:hypothetical protein